MPDHLALPGSFRDPAGFVYERDEQLFRSLSSAYWDLVRSESWSGFASELAANGRLVPYSIVGDEFSLNRLHWITYPYEWSPRQLRAAALLTLDIQLQALESGLSLKDASAFNVQFDGQNPIFIDHLSIESDPGTPWIGYRQFVEHFFAPLVLAELVSPRLRWEGIHGVSVQEASAILGKRGRWNLAIQIHIHQLAKRIIPGEARDPRSLPPQPLAQRKAILIQLRDAIASLKLDIPSTDWGDYYATTNYSPEQIRAKDQLVSNWLDSEKPKTLVDLGANDGKYSRLGATKGVSVLAIESDQEIVNRNFPTEPYTFICADLTTPSEGRGWMNRERSPLLQRAKSDAVLALAIIHHLVFSGQVPVDQVIEMIASLAPKAAIEWIEPEDSYVQRLIGGRSSGVHPYTRELFEAALARHYGAFRSEPIGGTLRTLYFCSR